MGEGEKFYPCIVLIGEGGVPSLYCIDGRRGQTKSFIIVSISKYFLSSYFDGTTIADVAILKCFENNMIFHVIVLILTCSGRYYSDVVVASNSLYERSCMSKVKINI